MMNLVVLGQAVRAYLYGNAPDKSGYSRSIYLFYSVCPRVPPFKVSEGTVTDRSAA